MATCDSSQLPDDAFTPPNGGGGGGSLFASDLLWINGTQSEVIDGASNVAFDFDTDTAWILGDLLSLKNNGIEHFKVDANGKLHIDTTQANNATIESTNGGLVVTGNEIVILGDNGFSRGSSTLNKSELVFGSVDNSSIYPFIHNSGTVAADLLVRAAHAPVNAGNGTTGGQLTLSGGDGAANAATNSDGGDLVLSGGAKVGTGSDGLIVLRNLPTADPLVTDAIWNDVGTLKISP